ncbi:PepSY-associated TM helix domain-containing protein [Sphingomonas sp.]|uniref:PepSY-associated TM helix domain-containing protein n=1 Tax=Sphingomonas sp. TaxID=28214 RepID=UPI002BD011C3|nr:PepSY-associated TM helix domain-containing protein [Sphingomonas sp.]HTG39087.1 PepSY-associated TM helix domain-containing protein [Sphingomonas sp.]
MRGRRQALRLWHRWFGLGAGLWLVLLSLTGIAIAWYDEIDTALNPDLRRVAVSQAPPAPLASVLAHAEAALPGFEARQVQLAGEPGRTHWLIGRARGDDGASIGVQVFADPATGAVAGWRESGALRLDRRHLMDLIYGVHTDLLLGPVAAWLLGLIALLWLADHGVGLVLSFPRGERWRDAFGLAGRSGSLRRLFDWHRAKGMWAWPLTATLALTGLTLAWPETTREAVRLVSPVNERLHEHLPRQADPAAPNVTLDQAVARVSEGGRAVHSVRPMLQQGLYAIRTFDPRDVDNQGRLWTYVSAATGQIMGARHDRGDSAGDAFFAWQYALHSGHAAGAPGRIAVSLGGAVTILLWWSGIRLWWRRRRR